MADHLPREEIKIEFVFQTEADYSKCPSFY